MTIEWPFQLGLTIVEEMKSPETRLSYIKRAVRLVDEPPGNVAQLNDAEAVEAEYEEWGQKIAQFVAELQNVFNTEACQTCQLR